MANETNIILAIVLSCFVMFTMAMVIVVFVVVQKRKVVERQNQHDLELKNKELELLKTEIETQERERNKIANDIHDQINPLLAMLSLNLTRIRKSYESGNDELKELLEKETEILGNVAEELGGVTNELSPRVVHRYGLVNSIRQHLDSVVDIKTSVDIDLNEELNLSKSQELNIYRIILELIQNIRKHETESYLDFRMSLDNGFLVIRINHDGNGISNEEVAELLKTSEGLGLNSLNSRVQLLSGELNYFKSKDVKVVLKVPLNNAKKD